MDQVLSDQVVLERDRTRESSCVEYSTEVVEVLVIYRAHPVDGRILRAITELVDGEAHR